MVYLLHGLTDNCTGWHRFSRVEAYARAKGAALVMPEVQRSFYTDMQAGGAYYTYVSEELPRFCEGLFRLSSRPRQRYVMGLSMGGYGALKCALRAPERYAGCAAFSAVTDVNDYLEQRRADPGPLGREAAALFGPGRPAPRPRPPPAAAPAAIAMRERAAAGPGAGSGAARLPPGKGAGWVRAER